MTPDPTIPAPAFTAEEFTHIADLLSNALNDENETAFRARTSNNVNIILEALCLAPVALAAIEYHDQGKKDLDLAVTRELWKALARAVAEYREGAA